MKRTTAGDADADTIAYRRVSKGEQAAEWKASLRQQTEAVTALAEKLGRKLQPEHVWEDRFSGEDAESRKGFMDLVARKPPGTKSRSSRRGSNRGLAGPARRVWSNRAESLLLRRG